MENKLIEKILESFNIQHDVEKLKPIPNRVIFASAFLSASALTQFILDVILETSSFFDLIPKIPFRVDFLSLTTISAFLAYQTLIGLRKRELDVTENSLQLGSIVESALIIGDLIFLYNNPGLFLIGVRLPFLFFTTINLILIIYIWIKVINEGHKYVYKKRRKTDIVA
ncbi:MAG: hypothetical protein AAGF07_02745 [Patescibacteria group bacterium]